MAKSLDYRLPVTLCKCGGANPMCKYFEANTLGRCKHVRYSEIELGEKLLPLWPLCKREGK